MAEKRKYDNSKRAAKAALNKIKKEKEKAKKKRNKAKLIFQQKTKEFNKLAKREGYRLHDTHLTFEMFGERKKKSAETLIKQAKAAEKKIKNFEKYGFFGYDQNQVDSARRNLIYSLHQHINNANNNLEPFKNKEQTVQALERLIDVVQSADDIKIALFESKAHELLQGHMMNYTNPGSTTQIITKAAEIERILLGG